MHKHAFGYSKTIAVKWKCLVALNFGKLVKIKSILGRKMNIFDHRDITNKKI